MVNKVQIKKLIAEILKELDLDSVQAEALVFNTGLVESKYEYLMQVKGPAIGFFQCEVPTAIDICLNYLKYRPKLMKKVAHACMIDIKYFLDPKEDVWRRLLQYNLALQISLVRLHYRRVPEKLPNNVAEQASQWKRWYNTKKGKGTEKHFIELVKAYGK